MDRVPGPAPTAWSLGALLVAVHVATGAWLWWVGGASPWEAWLGERSADGRVAVGGRLHVLVAAGAWWRLCSTGLLHVDGLHLAVNVVALGLIGRLVEPVAGGARLLGLFAVGTIAGAALGQLAGVPQSDGASAGLSAWLGAAVVWSRTMPAVEPSVAALWARTLGVVTVLNVVVAMVVPGIDAAAHLGGTLAGGVAAARGGPRGGGVVFAVFAVVAAGAMCASVLAR